MRGQECWRKAGQGREKRFMPEEFQGRPLCEGDVQVEAWGVGV